MAQVLPPDEDFAAPDWLTPSSGTTVCVPWFFWYPGFRPSLAVTAASYPTYPYNSLTGPLADAAAGLLYIPSDQVSPFPAQMTGVDALSYTGGFDKQRAVLCREEDSVAVEDIDYKVVFSIQTTGLAGAGAGSTVGGHGRGREFTFPTIPATTGDEFDDPPEPGPGGWQAGGSVAQPSDMAEEWPDLWTLWLGNGLFFRAGGGFPDVIVPGLGGVLTSGNHRTYAFEQVDHYSFTAYPVINSGTSAVDLVVELWECHWTALAGSTGVPRRLATQTVAGGASRINFAEPYFLRVTCDNAGADVELKAYLGGYTTPHNGLVAEVQCFKEDEFAAGAVTVTTTASVTANTTTGVVTDAHADKRTAYLNRTFGWSMGRDRELNVAPKLFVSGTKMIQGLEGVWSVEIKDISAGAVLYRDEFERSVGASFPNIISPVTGLFGHTGEAAGGMFTFDAYADQYGVGTDSVRRLAVWTAGPTVALSPNDYITLDYDADDSATDLVADVMRTFVHQRPSTQFFNHHRSIEFKPGAEYSKHSSILYQMGIALRGYFDGQTANGLVAYLLWVTDGTGSSASTHITAVHLVVAERGATYNAAAEDSLVVARRKWTSVSDLALWNNGGAYDLYDGAFHKLDFRAEVYGAAANPDAAALYHVEFDGNPIELDDPTVAYQSSTVTPYAVVHPGPSVTGGSQEAFWFLCDQSEMTGTGKAYDPVQARNWEEGALTADPGAGSPDAMASVVVGGEGTPTGSLNTATGALLIPGGGVFEVETSVDVEEFYPIRRVAFDSGHTYTSPAASKARRRWRVRVDAMPRTVMYQLQTFFNAHSGPEVPFSFVVPIPADGTGATAAESTETVSAWFADTSLRITEAGPQVYDAQMSIEELLVT